MERIWILLLSAPSAFLMHAFLCRIFPKKQPQLLAIGAMTLGAFPIAWLLKCCVYAPSIFTPKETFCAIVYDGLVYLGFSYAYFHIFNMSETARRIRLLYEIGKAGGMTDSQLLAAYPVQDLIRLRMERLLAAGQLVQEGSSYRIQGRLLYGIALAVAQWRNLLGFEDKKDPSRR